MTSKPEPADKLGRNMKALPANCQKLADGIQQSWNRAIPENDYIQLGTLRYGVRLSNTGLLEDAMTPDRGGKPANDHHLHHHHRSSSRGSSNGASYDHFSNGSDGGGGAGGGSRAGSIPCSTTSNSSEQPAANCCCIRGSSSGPSSNVETPPWTNSYHGTRTKLPVPATGNGTGSLNAKNRKSSPSASTASTVAGGWGGIASPATSPAHHQHQYQQQQQQQQQQQPRHLHLAPNRTTNGHALTSPSTQSHGHGSEDGPGLRYSNGHTNGGHLYHHNNNNNNNNGYHNNTNGAKANEEPDQHRQQQETSQTSESTSPRCSAVVCCYGNSFGTGTITGSGRKKRPTNGNEREPQTASTPGAPQQQQLREHRDAGVTVTAGGGADRRALHRASDRDRTTHLVRGANASVCVHDEDDQDADADDDDDDGDGDDVADDDVSALVAASQQLLYANGYTADVASNAGSTYDDGGRSSGSFYRFADGDLNLNPTNNAPQHQQQQQQVLQRWQSAPSGNAATVVVVAADRRELNINNFEKKPVASTEPHYGQSFVVAASGRQQHAVEPNRSASPTGLSGAAGSPDCWSVGRGRTLQPPSSLPVKSYSFHRDHRTPGGGGGGGAAGQLFDRCSPLFETSSSVTGRNISFRNAQQPFVVRRSTSATVRQHTGGGVPDEPRSPAGDLFPRAARQSPSPGCGAESEYHPAAAQPPPSSPSSPYGRVNTTLLTRKSSLPVLSSSRALIDECYPFDKSTCQPECILTPRSHRKQPCSDALNEIRLQSLNKYCNQLLLGQQPFVASPPRPSGRRGPPVGSSSRHPRPQLDELEDELGFIDSSDLSSAGDEHSGGHNGLSAITSKHPRRPSSQQSAQQQQQHSSLITHGTVRIAAAIVVTSGTLPGATGDGDVTGAATGQHQYQQQQQQQQQGRNTYHDSSSDELSSVCSGVEQLTRACASVVVVGSPPATTSNDQQPQQAAGNASNGGLLRSRWSGHQASGTLGSEQQNNSNNRSDNNNNNRRHRRCGDGHDSADGDKNTNTVVATVATSATSNVVNGAVGVSVSVATDVTGVSGGSSSSSRHQQQHQQSQQQHVGLNCFGRSASLHAAAPAAAAGGSTGDKSIMEKRSNTLDRLQRFVKKSTSSANAEKQQQQQSGGSAGGGGGQGGNGGSSPASTKTERLRELTELLTKGGNRGSSVPPPPPRRAKNTNSSMKVTTSTTSLIDSILSQSTGSTSGEMSPLAAKNPKVSRSVDLPYRFADSGQRMSTPSSPQPEHKPQLSLLRANVSTSNLEVALHEGTGRPLAKAGTPNSPGRGAGCVVNSETTLGKLARDEMEDQQLFVKLSRPESRTIVGSYTQKTIPFRSASFSQVDYSSGKYIRSALGALKNSLLSSKGGSNSNKDSSAISSDEPKLESTRSCSPTELCGGPTTTARYTDTDTDVAKLTIKKTELSINLIPLADDFGRLSCDDRTGLKRLDGKDLASNRNSDIETIVEDPVAEHVENVENPSPPPPPPPPVDEQQATVTMVNPVQASINVMQASEMELVEPPVEEGIPITPCSLSKDDECLQQATTCLIPVPVYDCVVSEWSTAKPSEQWIDASMTEYSKFQDCLGSIKEVNESAIVDAMPGVPPPPPPPPKSSMPESSSSIEEEEEGEDDESELPVEKITIARPPQIIEPLESVDLSEDVDALFCTPPVSIICTEPESNEFTTIVDGLGGGGGAGGNGGTTPGVSGTQHKVSVVLDDGSEVVEVVEVRKRHSNNEDAGGDTPSSRHSNEMDEKRRLESRKSRRKGIYIQWPAIDGNGSELEPDNTGGDGAVLVASPSSVTGSSCEDRPAASWTHKVRNEKDSSLELSGESFTDLSGREDGGGGGMIKDGMERPDTYSPDGRYRLDPTTPDSDTGRSAPVWPVVKGDATSNHRRQSLTYQSSDEKDDTLPQTSTSATPAGVRSLKSIFLRSDSVSDCESDRASSRDRTSASPAPGAGTEADLKRYSKRPLRGPYGQMLEAEMKKPTAKVQYNEILEELTRNESHGSLTSVSTTRSRGGAGSQSMDETNDRHTGGKASGKPRKTSANLPVPTHVRTASSPSKLSDTSSHSTGGGCGGGSAASRRHLSHIEQRSTDSDRSEKSGSGGGGPGLGGKKFSLDSHHHAASEKISKRASEGSGGVQLHEKHHGGGGNKRSCSSASDKQPKRSLDEVVRLSQNSRTPSERSIGTLQTPEMLGTSKGMSASPELLAELLKGSSEKLITEQLTTATATPTTGSPGPNAGNALPSAVLNCLDTRTHVVVELFNTEKSYVESLQTIVLKYLNQLKSPDNAGLVGVQTVDEIFFMVPAILNIHERFLEELRRRLDSWDKLQMIGDAFVDVFSRPMILETYTAFVNNWNRAKDAIRSAREKCPAFARFLEAMAREHKGKLSLDNLLIKPVQKFPNYELIFTRLIKHTDVAHPDQKPLQEALKLVHDILMFLNCKEKEALENGQRETALRELEGVIEGMNDLVTPDRAFLLFDLVSMPSGQVTRKERGFFLFNDLLVITSIKRRSGTIRKTNMTCPGSVASTLDTNKYKYLTKIALDDLEIVKSKDENVRRIMKEIEHLTDDSGKLVQIADLAASLRCSHIPLEEAIRDLQREIQRQLAERQTNDAQLNVLELTLTTSNGTQNMTVVFSKPDKRTQWEEIFTEAKQKLANSVERSQIPEFFVSVPIRKTRAGLQFTCASPTLGAQKDVWVCNSDGYVGQVCVLSLVPEPSVTSCNGVCNARILCVSSVPASEERASSALMNVNISIVDASSGSISNSSNTIGKPVTNSSSPTVNSSPAKVASDRKGSFKHARSDTGSRSVSNESDIQLDSGSSSEDSEPEGGGGGGVGGVPERLSNQSPIGGLTANHRQQDSTASCPMMASGTESGETTENQQSTMWLGTEDGCIHVYNCTDNIRIKKNKIKIPHVSAVYSILYLDNRVFVSLANGDICVYSRDRTGWNVTAPLTVTVGTVSNPVVKLLNVHGKLWCAIQGTIKVLNTKSLQIDSQIQISNDSKPITNMTVLNDYVWISVQNSAHIKCCHHESFEVIFEVNLAPSVNKMLSNCDDIIRQHKAACLRVTSLLACKDLIWVGTSAGVLLTIAAHNVAKGSTLPVVTGIPHGHTGHVRFLTFVESPEWDGDGATSEETTVRSDRTSGTGPSVGKGKMASTVHSSHRPLLVISGGDGYEDFRSTGSNTMSDVAGREDSTNHLLLWKV